MSVPRDRTIAFVVALATLVVGGAGGLQAMVTALKATLRKLPIEGRFTLPAVPERTPSWERVGSDDQMSAEMMEELGTENYLSRRYVERDPPEGRQPVVLDLHMAYYTGMVDTVPHVPDRCLVGAGWSMDGGASVLPLKLDQEIGQWSLRTDIPGRVFTARLGPDSKVPNTRVNLPRDADTMAIRVNPYIQPGSDRRMFAGYFFIANGGHCANAEEVRLLAFSLQDTYAYYLKVQVSTISVSTAEEYTAACRSLLGELLPEIMLCTPDWPELRAQAKTGVGAVGRWGVGHGFTGRDGLRRF